MSDEFDVEPTLSIKERLEKVQRLVVAEALEIEGPRAAPRSRAVMGMDIGFEGLCPMFGGEIFGWKGTAEHQRPDRKMLHEAAMLALAGAVTLEGPFTRKAFAHASATDCILTIGGQLVEVPHPASHTFYGWATFRSQDVYKKAYDDWCTCFHIWNEMAMWLWRKLATKKDMNMNCTISVFNLHAHT